MPFGNYSPQVQYMMSDTAVMPGEDVDIDNVNITILDVVRCADHMHVFMQWSATQVAEGPVPFN